LKRKLEDIVSGI